MSDQDRPEGSSPSNEERRGGRSRYALLPAATFLVGLLLGGILVWVAQPGEGEGEGDGSTAQSPSPSPGVSSPSSSVPPGSIVVPRACLKAAQSAEDLVTLARDAASALADLDAAALEDVVNRMQALDGRVRAELRECRQPEAP